MDGPCIIKQIKPQNWTKVTRNGESGKLIRFGVSSIPRVPKYVLKFWILNFSPIIKLHGCMAVILHHWIVLLKWTVHSSFGWWTSWVYLGIVFWSKNVMYVIKCNSKPRGYTTLILFGKRQVNYWWLLVIYCGS